MSDDSGHGEYVHKVRDETRRYIQDLLKENGRLRRRVGAQESQETRLKEEGLRLREQILGLRSELDRGREQLADLNRRLAEAEAESDGFSSRYVEVEEQNNNLANLYVASYHLHGTLARGDVLAAIQGIVINLIGCEEFAIFSRHPDDGRLVLEDTFGVDPRSLAGPRVAHGPIGRAAESGEIYVADGKGGGGVDAPIGCIPLKLAGRRVLGVVVLFRLLAHKEGFGPLDFELFDLLATQAATALYLSDLHAAAGAGIEVAAEGRG